MNLEKIKAKISSLVEEMCSLDLMDPKSQAKIGRNSREIKKLQKKLVGKRPSVKLEKIKWKTLPPTTVVKGIHCPKCGGNSNIWDAKDGEESGFVSGLICSACDTFFARPNIQDVTTNDDVWNMFKAIKKYESSQNYDYC